MRDELTMADGHRRSTMDALFSKRKAMNIDIWPKVVG